MFLSWEPVLLGFKNMITASAGEKNPKQTKQNNPKQNQNPKTPLQTSLNLTEQPTIIL